MPLYEYECEACAHRFERIQKFSDAPVEVCPKCGKKKLRKLVSSPAIQFKGSGFYINDYARKGAKGDESSKDTDSSKDSSAKTEKPAKNDEKSEKSADKPAAASSAASTSPAASSSGSKDSKSSSKD
ncbi:MAG TPA: zinc ribbon domain-containing protein [Vicinamibacterales bacterium]|jgi:putative FmdB family regulatory protein|nr:zinc ribbon domain-containing protein [Vicinamibacterales bacterium]